MDKVITADTVNAEKRTDKKNPGKRKANKINLSNTAKIISVLIIIALLVIIKAIITSAYSGNTVIFTDEARKCSVVASGKRIISDSVDGELSGSPVFSSDKKTAAFLTYTSKSDSSFYTLYSVKNNKVTKITNNVSSSFTLASSGNAVCYKDREGALKINSVTSQSDELISRTAEEYCVSPDGKTVIFTSYDESGLSYNLYCYKNGNVTEIGTGLIPVATENNAGIIYACDSEFKTLYSVSSDGKERSKISEIAETKILLNSDCTQMIFSSDSGTYICYSGSVRKLIFPFTDASPVFSDGAEFITTDEKHGVTVCPVDDFTQMYYYLDSQTTLSYINSDCSRNDISSDAYNVSVSDDLKYVYFTDSSNSLYMVKNGKNPTVIKEFTKDITVSPNGKIYTFTNLNNETEYAKNKKTLLSSNDIKFTSITSSGRIVCVLSETPNCVYEITPSGKLKTISDNADKILSSDSDKAVIIFEKDKKGNRVYTVLP